MFKDISEAQISRAIVRDWSKGLEEYITSDVIIVGGGPSGLMAGRNIALAGFKTLIIESNNFLGGGFWIGGYFMNTLTFRAPSQEILNALSIPYEEVEEGLFTASGPHACSKLIAEACDAGVKMFTMTKSEDVVYRNGKVEGVVINWSPISSLPRAISCLDPISLESKIVIDATGHDAKVLRYLEHRNLLKLSDYGVMDVRTSEDLVVEKTGFIKPGLLVTGMAVSTAYGLPRMGPTFGSMLVSGQKGAELAIQTLSKETSQTAFKIKEEIRV